MPSKPSHLAAHSSEATATPKPRRRTQLFELTVLLVLALGVVSQVHAVDFEAGVAAINDKLSSLPSRVRASNFRQAVTPLQWTPDMGVYQWYAGDKGRGAAYWSEPTGAHVIYGAILDYWEQEGYERRLGYPVTDEGGPVEACPSGTKRSQKFTAYATGTNNGSIGFCHYHLCWNGSRVEESNPLCS